VADYLLPEGMTAASAAKAIGSQLKVRNGHIASTQRVYYDTFDGLLYGAGLMVVWEDGWLSLIERDGERIRSRARIPKPARPLFVWDLPQTALRESLAPVIDVRALLALVEIRSRERPLDVLNQDGKTIVRLRVQQSSSGRQRLRGRVQVDAVRGYDKAYQRMSETLATEMGFEPVGPVVDEALVSAGRNPAGNAQKVDLRLEPSESTATAVTLVLSALLDVIENNLEGTITDLDSEFLHDLRVAVRRSRAVQREFRAAFPPDELARFRSEFRWLQQLTGETRDLDVYVLEFDQMRALLPEPTRLDLEPLLPVLRHRRRLARRRMVRGLRSPRTRQLLDDWRRFLTRLPELAPVDDPSAAAPIVPAAGARIAKVYRRMAKMGSAIGPLSPAVDYHELRKQGKELRYLLELFGAPLYPDEVVRPMIKVLKALQDVLGRHQDREIQVATLRSLGPEVAGVEGGAAAAMAMGMLVERLEADQLAAREAFAGRFAEFSSAQQRRLVKDTFE
jgi:CHAD domain-containing protein